MYVHVGGLEKDTSFCINFRAPVLAQTIILDELDGVPFALVTIVEARVEFYANLRFEKREKALVPGVVDAPWTAVYGQSVIVRCCGNTLKDACSIMYALEQEHAVRELIRRDWHCKILVPWYKPHIKHCVPWH